MPWDWFLQILLIIFLLWGAINNILRRHALHQKVYESMSRDELKDQHKESLYTSTDAS